MNYTFRDVRSWLINTYRTGYEKRWIPLSICENDWQHSKRATRACVAHIIWSPERVQNHKTFPLMGFWHDWVEWEKDMPDYTPACDITKQEKHRLESEVLIRLRWYLWEKYIRILDATQQYLDQSTDDAREMYYIDKSLAWVWWLEYERLWFKNMDDFHPYALHELSLDTYHTHIYQTLLERSFSDVDYFAQYFCLLKNAWDIDKFRFEMQALKNS